MPPQHGCYTVIKTVKCRMFPRPSDENDDTHDRRRARARTHAHPRDAGMQLPNKSKVPKRVLISSEEQFSSSTMTPRLRRHRDLVWWVAPSTTAIYRRASDTQLNNQCQFLRSLHLADATTAISICRANEKRMIIKGAAFEISP